MSELIDKEKSSFYSKEAEVIQVWNQAMGERKGKWIDKKPNMYTRKVYCSECGCMALSKVKSEGDVYNPRYTIEFAKSNFCPNCGADMRGDR